MPLLPSFVKSISFIANCRKSSWSEGRGGWLEVDVDSLGTSVAFLAIWVVPVFILFVSHGTLGWWGGGQVFLAWLVVMRRGHPWRCYSGKISILNNNPIFVYVFLRKTNCFCFVFTSLHDEHQKNSHDSFHEASIRDHNRRETEFKREFKNPLCLLPCRL